MNAEASGSGDRATNPFSPTFGVSPPILAGRQQILSSFRRALDEGVGSPGRATLYLGGRGSGKTVLLNEIEDIASQHGWLTVSETASPGLVERLTTQRLPMAARRAFDHADPPARLTSISGFGFGLRWETSRETPQPGDLRAMLTALAGAMDQGRRGLLITIDEIQGAPKADLVELAVAVQHLFRERQPIAVAFGGLPAIIKDRLLDESVLTFLRRAERHVVGPVAVYQAADALRETAVQAGKRFDADAVETAAEASAGYPFMIQLIGYHVWQAASRSDTIGVNAVNEAIPEAERRLGSLVLEPALGDLSPNDRRFLLAMSLDSGPSKIGELARRLGFSSNQASQYRLRLLDSQMISSPARGLVDIAMPYLRSYLRTHGALGETL